MQAQTRRLRASHRSVFAAISTLAFALGSASCGGTRGAPDCEGSETATLAPLQVDVWGDQVVLAGETQAWAPGCTPDATLPEWLAISVDEVEATISFEIDADALPSGAVDDALLLGDSASPIAELNYSARKMPTPRADATHHVVFVGIDGLRPDGLEAAETPNLDRLFGLFGTIEDDARIQATGDSISGPGWASIMTGVEVEAHDVQDNDNVQTIDRAYPTILERVRASGGFSYLAVHWPTILAIAEPSVSSASVWGSDRFVGENSGMTLATVDLDLLFSHFDDVDGAGHSSGFTAENPAYLAAIEAVDTAVGDLLTGVYARDTLEDEAWLFIMTTDHGGLGTSHSGRAPEMLRIPVAMASPPGTTIRPGATPNHMDVAPTIAAWLSLPEASRVDGEAWAID